jgi:mercuric reductase
MGSKVTILCRSHLLPSEEPEVSKALEEALVVEGIKVQCEVVYQSITVDEGICLGYVKSGQHHDLVAEQVLVATGRRPNSAGLGLEEMGVDLLSNAGIKVDPHMQTTRKGVYAVGDVTGQDMYVYMAAYGAKIAAKNVLNGDSRQYENTSMPRVTFTGPQVASVGVTEAQARKIGYDVKTSILGLENVPRALAARDMRGMIKLVADKASGKLIGASIIAPEGADSIQTAAIAIKVGMTSDQLGEMIFPYLTTVEGFKLAAQTFDKDVTKFSCCAG